VWCANNPVMRVDKNGMDDIFNEDGSFSHSTKKGSNIYLGDKLLTDVDLNSSENRQAVANVVGYYAGKVGIRGIVGLKNRGKDESIAFIDEDKIYINKHNNKINGKLHNIHNMKSTLKHEKGHKDRNHGFKEPSSFQHAEVYFEQISDAEFTKTTKNFKEMTFNVMVDMLEEAANFEYYNIDNIQNLLDRTDAILKKYGYEIGINRNLNEVSLKLLKK
jgi:hypothetical protein